MMILVGNTTIRDSSVSGFFILIVLFPFGYWFIHSFLVRWDAGCSSLDQRAWGSKSFHPNRSQGSGVCDLINKLLSIHPFR